MYSRVLTGCGDARTLTFGLMAIQLSSISAHAWSISLLCSAYSALLYTARTPRCSWARHFSSQAQRRHRRLFKCTEKHMDFSRRQCPITRLERSNGRRADGLCRIVHLESPRLYEAADL
jgi:hypothetical protein